MRNKLIVFSLTIVIFSLGYTILAKNLNLWPFHKPKMVILEEQLDKKYGQDYKPIYIYINVGTPVEKIELLKKQIEQFPEVITVEEIPWPKQKSGYSAALKLIPMVKRDPKRSDYFYYPSKIIDFLGEGKTNPSHTTRIINNWSLKGEPNDFFDYP